MGKMITNWPITYNTRWLLHWGLLCLAAPAMLFSIPLMAVALLLLPVCLLLQYSITTHIWTNSAVFKPLLFLTLAGCIGYVSAAFGAADWHYALPRLGVFLWGWVAFNGLVHTVKDRTAARIALNTWLCIALAFAALAVLGTQFPAKLLGITLWQPVLTVQAAPVGFHPNQVAGTLLWLLPLPVWLALRASGSLQRLLYSGAGMVLLTVLMLTQSRGAWLGAIIATAAVLLLTRHPVARLVGAMLLFLLVAVAGAAVVRPALFQQLTGVFELEFRQRLWVAGWQAFLDFRYTGMGLGMFRRLGPLLYSFPQREVDVAHAHNYWLHTGAELGFVGLVAQVWVWVSLCWMMWKQRTHHYLRWFVLAGVWSLLAFFVFGLTDTVALGSKPSIVWWVQLGLWVGVISAETQPK